MMPDPMHERYAAQSHDPTNPWGRVEDAAEAAAAAGPGPVTAEPPAPPAPLTPSWTAASRWALLLVWVALVLVTIPLYLAAFLVRVGGITLLRGWHAADRSLAVVVAWTRSQGWR